MRIKVCGLTRAQDVRLACGLGAWAAGFAFVPGRRHVQLRHARRLCAQVPPGVLKVGVFNGCSRRDISLTVRACGLDAVELRGGETPEGCAGYPVPVFKAVRHSRGLELADLKSYVVEHLRLAPTGGESAASESLRECWQFAARARGFSVILAGGLTPDNVAEAIAAAKPYAVEVCSGAELESGIKDPRLLKAFFAAAL
jgi:phosphoribosylanthranilate isomerase